MPPKIPSFKKIQREIIMRDVLREFRHRKLEKTSQEGLREVIFSWILGMGIPIVSIGVILIIKLNFFDFFTEAPFLLFFSPIFISTWLAGIYSGFMATLLGAFFAFYIFTPPYWTFHIGAKNDLLLLTYIVEGILISYFIANQKKAKIQAESIQSYFELLLENTTDYGIVFFDQQGYITNFNEGAHRLTGYKNYELKGKLFSILYTPEDKQKGLPEKEFSKALRVGKATDENYLQRKNGSVFFASGFTTALWTQNNQLFGFIKLFRDVTEAKRLEQEKEDFISIAAHELKNPVASTSLYLQLLQKYYRKNPNEEAQQYLKKAAGALQRLLDLISTLLDVSQIQKSSMHITKEEVNINHLVRDIIDVVQSGEKQHKIIQKGAIKANIMVDKRRLEEVLINLINNAIKYSPEAKSIMVKLENKKKDIIVSVRDYGIGMTHEVASKVFERFYRGGQKQIQNIQGLGLGLYISSQIVHAHGGEMFVTSRFGKGSTFSFRIPKK